MGFERSSVPGCELVAEVAREFGEVRFRAIGFSMMPVILPGDVLTVRRCGVADLRPEDVILYRRNEALVAHRIVRMDEDRLITRGDSVRHEDSPIGEPEIVGQVVSVDRRGRAISLPLSFWSRAGSRLLRRSDLCLRAAVLAARWLLRPDSKEISWA